MVELSSARLDRVFHALSDATRRDMLRRLAGGEHTVSELAEPFHMSLAAASKHIRTLEEAGLIQRTVEGRTHRCRIEASARSSRACKGSSGSGRMSSPARRTGEKGGSRLRFDAMGWSAFAGRGEGPGPG